jgi:hypothetical protein
VIISIIRSELHSRALHDHSGWEGTVKSRDSALHLGIVQQSLARKRGSIDVLQLSRDGFTGWGFGNRAGIGDVQGYVWDGKPVKETVFEIAVTNKQLTSDEAQRLLPD